MAAKKKAAASTKTAPGTPAKKKAASAKKKAAPAKKKTASAKKKAAPAKKKTASAKKKAARGAGSGSELFDAAFLDAQREALIAERSRCSQHADFLHEEADQLARDREPGDVQFDEESGEGDSIAVERDRDLQLEAQARAAIEEIDAALARLDAGTYGICVASGLPIPKERLEAIPQADMRVEYKSRGSAWR